MIVFISLIFLLKIKQMVSDNLFVFIFFYFWILNIKIDKSGLLGYLCYRNLIDRVAKAD